MRASAKTSHDVEIGELGRSVVKPIDDYLNLGEAEIYERIQEVKQRLGESVVILGHHYQRDDVICHADLTGDSCRLRPGATRITSYFAACISWRNRPTF